MGFEPDYREYYGLNEEWNNGYTAGKREATVEIEELKEKIKKLEKEVKSLKKKSKSIKDTYIK